MDFPVATSPQSSKDYAHSLLANGNETILNQVKPPSRSSTVPTPSVADDQMVGKHKKRIIVCCDGTWQDGVLKKRWEYTNILRLARTIKHQDGRHNPPIHQIVFYQTGIGSDPNFYAEFIDGPTGASLAGKVQEAYAFIAHNFRPGDEIFLFGFSRGAYTARMVAMFIGEIGVLDRTEMDNFAEIFVAYQKRGKAKDPTEIEALDRQLARWTAHTSPGKQRADSSSSTFSIKCVGVFDTVGSLGLPEELTGRSEKVRQIFGFPDKLLGEHVEAAYQALALNETRKDFDCAKFKQTEGGRKKGQILKQCWFTGSHSDVGGGFPDHDLSDLTLTWMVANVGDILAIDISYLVSLTDPVGPWGKQKPHDSRSGIFCLATTVNRVLPTAPDIDTHETIHASVLCQAEMEPTLEESIVKHPELVCELMPLEEQFKVNWPRNFRKCTTSPDDTIAKHSKEKNGKSDRDILQLASRNEEDLEKRSSYLALLTSFVTYLKVFVGYVQFFLRFP